MKIAIVTNLLYPEGLGGTELFCYQLANALIEGGNEVYWFAPNFRNSVTVTEERGKGIKIIKFAAVDETGIPTAAFTCASFIKEMGSRNIRIAHFNEFGGYEGVSAELLAEAKKAHIATIVTLHLATYLCHTGTLHYGGKQVCDGRMIINRCASCHLFSDRTSSQDLNLLMARFCNNLFNNKTVRSLPRIRQFLNNWNIKTAFITSLKENADVVVSLTHWFKEILINNGIPEHKIVYMHQVSPDISDTVLRSRKERRKGYAFFGRVYKEKGIDMLLSLAKRLKKRLPDTVIDLYGPNYGNYVETAIPGTSLKRLGETDNIRYRGVLPSGEVLQAMDQYKAILLPSLIAEMAPLIIMETNKLKVPVIVSDVPGSVELVKEYDCGLVFEYGSVDGLFEKIMEIETNMHEFAFRQPAENNFYHTAKKYEKIYETCISDTIT